jgi:hypothetical protein
MRPFGYGCTLFISFFGVQELKIEKVPEEDLVSD